MSRVYNFSAGPAMLPEPVLKRAQEEMLDWQGSGMSVMEMSHRGKEFVSIAAKAESDLRKLMSIPENYKVLFLQGGATGQFAAIPMNLLGDKSTVDYIHTGAWAEKAIKEAKKYAGNVNVAASSEAQNFMTVPARDSWNLSADAAYVHYTANETIGGIEFQDVPEVGDVPLVTDMSSNILSRPVDVSKFGLIYAGSQKNIGPAGLCIVIVRDDLLGKASAITPSILNYKVQAEADSMSNTPPTYTWYLAGLAFEFLLEQGGLAKMAEINDRKAKKLYAAIDGSDFYGSPVDPAFRSMMNVPFTLAKEDLEKPFLEKAKAAGLHTLAGHRSVGGMRASIYNAMPEAGVDALIEFMQTFERENA